VATHGESIARWRAELGATHRPLVVAVGRVAPEKGHHVLAEASAILASRGYDPVVVVAGPVGGAYERPGPARSALWRDIEALVPRYAERTKAAAGAATFELLGGLTPLDVKLLLTAADVFVAPSLCTPEPCPLPILEDAGDGSARRHERDRRLPRARRRRGPARARRRRDGARRRARAAARRRDVARRAWRARRPQAARHTWDATAAALDALVAQLT
jgi:hypothetical protein